MYGVWVGIIGWVYTNAMEYMYTQFAFILNTEGMEDTR